MIYPWIWRRLPGPWLVRLLLAAAMVASVFAICAWLLFPQVAERLEDGGGAVTDSAARVCEGMCEAKQG